MGNIIQTAEFTSGLQDLSTEDRYRVYDAIGKVARDSRTPGLQVKRMQRVDLWEIRASQELRIIAKLDAGDVFCLAVGHHDATLARAQRMRPPSTEDRGRLAEKASAFAGLALEPTPTPSAHSNTGPLGECSDASLIETYGIPSEWLATIRTLRTQDQVLGCGIHEVMVEERFWALIEKFETPSPISTGAKPVYRISSEAIAKAFAAGRIEQLEFNLPPSSWAIVHSPRRSPQLVKGGPGSGKTLIALYRALDVIESPSLVPPRVLYVTYTKQLRDDATEKIRRLRGTVPPQLEIATFDQVAARLAPSALKTVFDGGALTEAADEALRSTKLDRSFFLDEIASVIEARNVTTFDEYAKLARRGRGARLSVADRERVWACYQTFSAALEKRGVRTIGAIRMTAALRAAHVSDAERYDFVVVDELQDLPGSVIAMVVALAKGEARGKHLMLVGDAGQSIWQRGFRWSEVGIRLGGANVHTLAQSERSTTEILAFGRALLAGNAPVEQSEPGGSSKHGAPPRIVHGFRSADHCRAFVADEIAERIRAGANPGRFAVIAHGKKELAAIESDLSERGVPSALFQTAGFYRDRVKLITSHSSKGLEFTEVYVPDANDGTYPFYTNAALEEDEREERDALDCALLYVACTRAADALTVLYDRKPSPFLQSALGNATLTDVRR